LMRAAKTVSCAASRPQISTASPSGGADPQQPAEVLEMEIGVLRQRIADLTGSVERMRRDLPKVEPAQPTAATVARPPLEHMPTPQSDANAVVLIALGGIAALLGSAVMWVRSRSQRQSDGWPRSSGRAHGVEAQPQSTEAPIPRVDIWSQAPGVQNDVKVEGKTEEESEDENADAGRPALMAASREPAAGNTNHLDVAELTQVTEEARVYLALDHVDRAMDVLRAHICGQTNSVPAAWLMLLDLYRTHGREEEFRGLAAKFHRRFNAQTPQWARDQRNLPHDQGLEAYPRVIKQLVQVWGTTEAQRYLDGLLRDNCNGCRVGFSLAAYNDILTLRQLSDTAQENIDADLIEEQRVRVAFAAAAKEAID